jgi:hypothetical protein
MRKLELPSVLLHLLHRVYACSTLPWRIILAEGERTEKAARHLVALGLIRVWTYPERYVGLTALGRGELSRRRRQ